MMTKSHFALLGDRLREYLNSLDDSRSYAGDLLREELDLLADAVDRDAGLTPAEPQEGDRP